MLHFGDGLLLTYVVVIDSCGSCRDGEEKSYVRNFEHVALPESSFAWLYVPLLEVEAAWCVQDAQRFCR